MAVRDAPGIGSHELAELFGCSVRAIHSHVLRAGRQSLIRNVEAAGRPAAWVATTPGDDDRAEVAVQRVVSVEGTTLPPGLGPRSVFEVVR